MRQTLDAATRTAESEFVTVRKSGLKGLRNKIACLEKELRMAKRTIWGLASPTSLHCDAGSGYVHCLIEIVQERKRKPVKSHEQPQLFDRGNGTYGPVPQALPASLPAQARADSRIPMDQAFREVVGFVTGILKDSGEQWSDQSRQDFVSTVFISAQKLGILKVWERP